MLLGRPSGAGVWTPPRRRPSVFASSSAVGVAISVTSIPASAYLGVAASVGDAARAGGALAVLGINIAMLLIGGSLTLLIQRGLGHWTTRPATQRHPD
jgi:hypothetical protein